MTITLRRLTLGVALVALTALVVAPALAQHRRPGGHRGHETMHGMGQARLFDELDLTDDQRHQVRDIHEQKMEAMKNTREQLGNARRELFDQIQAEELNEPAIRDRAAAVAAIESDIAVAHAKTARLIREVLTPDQRARAAKIHQHHREMLGREPRGRFGHHGHGMGGGDHDEL